MWKVTQTYLHFIPDINRGNSWLRNDTLLHIPIPREKCGVLLLQHDVIPLTRYERDQMALNYFISIACTYQIPIDYLYRGPSICRYCTPNPKFIYPTFSPLPNTCTFPKDGDTLKQPSLLCK